MLWTLNGKSLISSDFLPTQESNQWPDEIESPTKELTPSNELSQTTVINSTVGPTTKSSKFKIHFTEVYRDKVRI